jgi:hypothetical protein
MRATAAKFRLELIGSFRLAAPDGSRVVVSAVRARILLAMLATAQTGERSRGWLQDHLWGSRDRAQAQASLRRELCNLRPLLNSDGPELLSADNETVVLNLALIDVDVRQEQRLAGARGEFLEGFDLAFEEGFEDWLREERQSVQEQREVLRRGPSTILLAAAPLATDLGGRPKLAVLVEPQDLPGSGVAVVEGIAYDVAERIARLRWLLLIGTPAGTLRGDDPAALARASALLGVDYLLHCRLGTSRTFHAVLMDSGNRLLWSGRHPLSDPVQSSDVEGIVTAVVAALTMQIETSQQQRVRHQGIHQLSANELVWRARWHMRRLTREDARLANDLLDLALASSPDSSEVILEQGYAEAWDLWAQGAATGPIEALRRRIVIARDLDPHDARAWLLLGILDMWLSRHDSAMSLMREAIGLNPSLSFAYGHLGSCHSLASQPAEAFPLVRTALKLNPLDTHNFHQFGELALANLMLGEMAQAVADADHALARRPGYVYGHALKAAALWLAGDSLRAREAGSALLRVRPRYDPSSLEWLPFKDRSWNGRLRQAVAASIQGGAPA